MRSHGSPLPAGHFCLQAGTRLLAICWLASSARSQDSWPQFRGPAGLGISLTARPPLTFSKTTALWSVDVPSGHSSPVVLGNQIFLTTFEESRLACRAYDRATGKLLWAKPVAAEKIEETHAF